MHRELHREETGPKPFFFAGHLPVALSRYERREPPSTGAHPPGPQRDPRSMHGHHEDSFAHSHLRHEDLHPDQQGSDSGNEVLDFF